MQKKSKTPSNNINFEYLTNLQIYATEIFLFFHKSVFQSAIIMICNMWGLASSAMMLEFTKKSFNNQVKNKQENWKGYKLSFISIVILTWGLYYQFRKLWSTSAINYCFDIANSLIKSSSCTLWCCITIIDFQGYGNENVD